MSKGTKKQYKQFTINTVEDACLVLKSLIVPVIIDLEKFKMYSDEAEQILKQYNRKASIPADVYDSIHDKVLYQQRELLRFLADHQSASFSYIEVRKILVNKKILKRELLPESNKILNELLDVRNWSFHNVQSMLTADLELAKNSVPEELRESVEIRPMLNPVIIRKVKSYDWKMLEGFVDHNKIREAQFDVILTEMKADYQSLMDELPESSYIVTNKGLSREVQYIEYEINAQNPNSAGRNIASLSMGIQKGKYDGMYIFDLLEPEIYMDTKRKRKKADSVQKADAKDTPAELTKEQMEEQQKEEIAAKVERKLNRSVS